MSGRMATDAIDLSVLDFWDRPAAEREHDFATLRASAPISHQGPVEDVLGISVPDPQGYWAVLRHSDIRAVSRNPTVFCSGQGVIFGDTPPEMLEASQSFIAMDAPRHTKLRGLVSSTFTPRRIARIEEQIAANARTVVDEAAPTGGGDFVELIAKRLPLMMISDMIGVPEADRERVRHAADVMVSAADPEVIGDASPLEALGAALWTLTEAANELAAHRESNPSDDLMTALVQAEIDGDKLTHAEIAAFFVLLSVAGNDTTRHTTTHAMRALTVHRDQWEALRAAPEERMPAAVEEFIRWATPVMTFRRTATRDTELAGQAIAAGEKVVLFYGSGNRDETVFDEPQRFDISRDPNRHLGFGGGGPHFCLGASLARTSLRVLFTALAQRMPDLEVGELQLTRGAFIHAVGSATCSFTPSA